MICSFSLRHTMFACLVAGLPGFMNCVPAQAQGTPTAEQLIERLKEKGRTRGLTPVQPAADAAERQFIESLKGRRTRGLSAGERNRLNKIALTKPSVDLTIYFDYDSDRITDRAAPTLAELGKALASDRLRSATIMLAGHTDARGSNEYNQALSERRARSVKAFLMERFGIAEGRLIPLGYGEEQLKDARNPEADVNRRVQIVNLGR